MHKIHIKDGREQSGVAEQNNADDRLRSTLENQLQSGFTDYVFMTIYRNMCVVRIIGEERVFQKKGLCESLDECYLYIRVE